MNPLSKAFVILSTLLTVALSCFSVAVVGRQDEWKKKFESEHAQNMSVTAQLATSKAVAEKVEGEANAKVIEVDTINKRLQSELTTASASASKAQADVNKLTADLEGANAALKISVVNQERINQERESYAKQYIESLGTAHKLGDEKAEIATRLADVSDELRRTRNDLERFKELSVATGTALNESKKEVASLQGQLGVKKLPGTVPVAATQSIAGAITAVGQASNGVTLVQINVGEKDQLAAGMELTISRGADYLGTMVVTSVNTDAATGRLTNARGAIAKGDNVYIRGYSR